MILRKLNLSLPRFFMLFVFLTCIFVHAEEAPRGSRTIYLVRHGQADYSDTRDPEVGVGLLPLGVAQARLVADRLAALPVRMTSIRSSTFTRARQTGQVIDETFHELNLEQTRLLCECVPPTWRERAVANQNPEDMAACAHQLDEAFETFFIPSPDAEERHDMLVAHGCVIRYLATKALKVDTRAWLEMSIGNCSLTIVRVFGDGSMKLLSYGDVGHIPVNLQSGLGVDAPDLIPPEAR